MPYFWGDEIINYQADNVRDYSNIIEVKRLNFFIGRNNVGKSRFLRSLLKNKKTLINYSTCHITNELIHIVSQLAETNPNHIYNVDGIDLELTQFIPYVKNSFSQLVLEFTNRIDIEFELRRYFRNINVGRTTFQQLFTRELNQIADKIKQNIQKFTEDDFHTLYYFPTLRGMRPVSDTLQTHAYQHRSVKDYSIDKQKILTGENLYSELQNRLLGEPEDRQLIENYQTVLSQYFFDNETITLIPKIGTDVVHIKIGDAKQFPIYQLGDGLQQAIILTYDAFLRKDEIHAYCIEEPELHMHAGMVRQLMNFYLNETQHYYFFTTHSNHLLDMADESDEVMIQKFSKLKDENGEEYFQINRCDRDRELLQTLGVKPSSVYLANCTVWVEGITDRLYLLKYMERYLKDLKEIDSNKYQLYRRFMLHYHYAFVEYAGANMVHWSFDEIIKNIDGNENKGLSARAIASDMLLIADADTDKANRISTLNKELGKDKLHLLKVKEIENTLPKELIIAAAKMRFEKMQSKTKSSFDIDKLDIQTIHFNDLQNGIGRILDQAIRKPRTGTDKRCFGEESGTIKDKLKFCHEVIQLMDSSEWALTDEATNLAKAIFEHIDKCNT